MNDVINYIKGLNINEKVVVACSYGPDSMCLLDLIRKCDLDVIVAHVNHKLRKESDDEYINLKKYCFDNNIIFEGYVIEDFPKGNVENVAREIRYNFFEDILKKYNSKYLFTAHHGDDLVETVLMRLARGASFRGYGGFNIFSKVKFYNLVRPLVFITKDDIINYVNVNKLPYAIDATNLECVHTRNVYRHKVLPVLKEINPKIHKKFIKFSNNIYDYYNYVNEEVNSYKVILYDKNRYLDINELNMLPMFILRLLIESILFDVYSDKINVIEDKHVDLIINLIYSNKSNNMVNLPLDIIAYKFYNIIDIKRKEEVFSYDYIIDRELFINNGYLAYLNYSDVVKSNYLIRLSSNDVKMPLHVRNRRVGDKMSLKNGTKSVGEILSEGKINKLERDIFPLVVDDDDKILWIPGVKKSKFDRQIDEEYDIIIEYIKKEKKDEKE